MPITLNGDTGIQTPMYNGTITANAVTPSVNMKNRIINGAMVIDQRNAGASVTPANNTYNLDRWKAYLTQSSKFTVQQDAGAVTPPAGFSDYLGVTSSSAYSVLTGDYFLIAQAIEGYNVADLAWGTANAKTVTLSFWVRSSLTGTFGGAFGNNAGNRAYPFSYTISAANTWEYKTITVTGDTTGTWLTTNSTGIIIYWSLGTGSSLSGTAGAWAANGNLSATGATSVVGTNGATFYITGVQLEVGSTATSFDYRPYGTELQLCQRYFQKIADGASNSSSLIATITSDSSISLFGLIPFQVPMRTTATLAITATSFRANMGTVNQNSTTAPTITNASNINARYEQLGYTGLTTDRSGVVRLNSDSGYVAVQAEL